MATSKIRIKMGEVEVEFEGSEAFLKDELKELLEGVVNLHKTAGISTKAAVGQKEANDPTVSDVGGTSSFTGTTNSVAAKLGVKTGPDLIIAAIARATLVSQVDTCDRETIIKEMKSATSYFHKNYISNLSTSLKGLLKDRKITEISTGTFALGAAESQRVKNALAD